MGASVTGLNQNQNKSINSTAWSHCPKSLFPGIYTVSISPHENKKASCPFHHKK